MNQASVSPEGSIRLEDGDVVRDWSSLPDLAADYWRHQRLSGKARESDDMSAWTCVHDLVGEPAADQAVDLLDELLRQAADDEVPLVAAGPFEELVTPTAQGRRFISRIEDRARQDHRWAAAIAGIWLDRDADPDVNRRLAAFGARHPDGRSPS